MQLLVEKGTVNNDQTNKYRDALQLGCIKSHIAIVDHLIRAGADPNKADERGWTPLLCASQFQQKTVSERLLAAGGDIYLASQTTTLPPTLWSATDKSIHLLLDENGMTARYVGKVPSHLFEFSNLIGFIIRQDTENNSRTKAAAVRANHLIPLQISDFYFEITILNSGENG